MMAKVAGGRQEIDAHSSRGGVLGPYDFLSRSIFAAIIAITFAESAFPLLMSASSTGGGQRSASDRISRCFEAVAELDVAATYR